MQFTYHRQWERNAGRPVELINRLQNQVVMKCLTDKEVKGGDEDSSWERERKTSNLGRLKRLKEWFL